MLDREIVRRANRLEEVIPALTGHAVSRHGSVELMTRCPWHDDQHLSLRVDSDKQEWYCDTCKSGGDVFAFVEKHRGVDFTTALSFLADRAGLPVPVNPRIVATFDYRDLDGRLLYQSCRKEPGSNGCRKTFVERRPDGQSGWIYNLNGIERVLFGLAELRGKKAVFIPEGER